MDVRMIGYKMHQVRKNELNMTQEEFADLLAISKDTVSNIERGKVTPSITTLIKLAEITHRPIDFFLSGELIIHHEVRIPLEKR